MPTETEQTIRFYRGQSDQRGGLLVAALLEVADQRDDLLAACKAAQSAFYSSGIDGVVKLAEAMELVDDAIAKTKGGQKAEHATPPEDEWDVQF